MKFPNILNYITDKDTLITSTQNSKVGIHIPDVIIHHSPGFKTALKTRRHILHRMIGCLIQSKISASSIKKNPVDAKTHMSKEDLKALESFILSLGISSIGYTVVNRDYIFKDKAILYPNAIVITMEMKKEAIKTAPSSTAIKEIFRTYYALGVAVNKISTFLRKRGYKAMAGPAIGGDVNYVPLAEDAGLGAIGKHGLLISDFDFGPSMRLAAVYTEIENLPFSTKNDHLWIKAFCDQCNKCVRACPAQAIYEHALVVQPSEIPSRSIDYTKCGQPFAQDYGCTVCIKSCTFFNNDYYQLKTKNQ